MSNWELQLVSFIILEGRRDYFEKALDLGIKSNIFSSLEAKTIWDFTNYYFNRNENFGHLPSEELLRQNFKNIELIKPTENFIDLCRLVKESHSKKKLIKILEDSFLQLKSNGSPTKIISSLNREIGALEESIGSIKDVNFNDLAFNETLDEMTKLENTDGTPGLPWPWPKMNLITGGIQPGDYIMLYGLPKSMKCLKSALITTRSGERIDISNLPDIVEVPSYTNLTGKVRWASAKKVESGIKNCVRVTTSSGLVIESGDEHYFMVPNGTYEGNYERIKNLKVGDYVATSHNIPEYEPISTWLTNDIAWLLGVIIGDGSVTKADTVVTNTDQDIIDRIIKVVDIYDCKLSKAGPIEYRIIRKVQDSSPNKINKIINDIGLRGKKSINKEIPACIYTSSKEIIASFIAGLFDTDGTVGKSVISFYTSSFVLAEGIQHLLGRLGLISRIRSTDTYTSNNCYSINIFDQAQHKKFFNIFKLHISCLRKLNSIEFLTNKKIINKRNVDTIPVTDKLRELIDKESNGKKYPTKLSKSQILRNEKGRQDTVSKYLLNKIAEEWDSSALKKIVNSDIVWDKITSIEYIGEHMCYDLCIQDGQDPNYLAGGYIVHNTWTGLVVAFHLFATGRDVLIYSREMMWPAIRRRGVCILAKVNYDRFKKNLLSEEEKVRVLDTLERIKSFNNRLIFTSADKQDGGPGGPSDIRRKMDMYKPHFVLLDSAYMLEIPEAAGNPYDWKNMSTVNRQLKQIFKSTGIPGIAILQENERAAYKYTGTRGTASLAMNTNAIMDCDLAIRAVVNNKLKELSLHLPAGREIKEPGFTIHADVAEDFSYAHDRLHQIGDEFKDEKDNSNNPTSTKEITNLTKAASKKVLSLVNKYKKDTIEEEEVEDDEQE